MKIKVRTYNTPMPEIIKKGDWIDLYTEEDVNMTGPFAETLHKRKSGDVVIKSRDVMFDNKMISLGVAMKLPKGFEVVVLPRSSTYKKWGIILANSQGVIDNSFCGNEDIWHFPAIALRKTSIPVGTRIAQFRIQLSQHATFWQKIKWLFSSKIKLVQVDNLSDNNRGGFGSTGE